MPLVSVVVTCHGRGEDFRTMLHCLTRQYEYAAGAHSRTGEPVLWASKGPLCKLPTEVIATWDGTSPILLAPARRYLNFKIIECPKEGSPGHHTRGPGIAASSGDWIVLTNMDNYFVQGWRHRINDAISDPEMGIVFWNTLSNLWRWSNLGGTKLHRGGADLSCFAVRMDIATKVGFPFREYDGDWDYIEACMKEGGRRKLNIHHIDETLSVHN